MEPFKQRYILDKSEVAEKTISSAAQNVSEVRARLMRYLADAREEEVAIADVARQLDSVEDQKLADALMEGVHDGLFDVRKDTVRLTSLGKRASRVLF